MDLIVVDKDDSIKIKSNIVIYHTMTKGQGKVTQAQVSRAVNKIIQDKVQKKRITLSFANIAVSTAGNENGMGVLITAGAKRTQRIGNHIKLKSAYMKAYFTIADGTNVCRVVIYRARKGGTTLLGDSLSVTGSIDPDKYFIYSDRLIPLSANGDQVKQYRQGLKLNNLSSQYDSDTGVPEDNDIRVYIVSDSDIASHPVINGNMHLWFSEI